MEQAKKNEIIILAIGFIFSLVAISPLFYFSDYAILGDGNILLQRLEAMRMSIVEYSQWPGLNIWNAGGQPLDGHAGIFPVSIKSILILLFGVKIGLNVAIFTYVAMGYIGAWLLSSLLWKNVFFKSVFSILIVINLPLLFHLSAGHIIFYVYYLIPLLLYFLSRYSLDRWSGAKAGVLFGLMFNDTPAYLLQYISIIIGIIILHIILFGMPIDRRSMIRWLALFLVICMTLISYHLVTIYEVTKEFPRDSNLFFGYAWSDIFKAYFYPFTDIEKVFSTPAGVSGGSCSQSTHEISAYLGIIGFALVAVSLVNGVKWWHSLILLLFIAGIGNDSVLHPMYWLQKLPSFSSHLCFSRVRIITHLFLPFAITGGLWILWNRFKMKKYGRIIVIVIGVMLILEKVIIGFMIVKDTHVNIESADPFYRTHYEYAGKDNRFINVNVIPPFEATQLNIGILRGGGDSNLPMNNKDADGYEGPIGKDEEGYIAEFHQRGKSIEPDYWSPNKIVFSDLDPVTPLILNMNPSSAWHSNGVQLYPNYKIVEVNKEFSVMPNKDGRIILLYEFPGRKLGLTTTILFFIITIVVVSYFRRSDSRIRKECRN